jgi:regulatory protein
MKITAIQEQQKHKDRLNVLVDGTFAFGVHMDVLLDFQLKIGMELTEALVTKIKTADAFRQAYDKALNYLSGRPHSAQEVRQYLRNRLIYKHPDYAGLTGEAKEMFRQDQEVAGERIVDKLRQVDYLDDAAFAKWWISNRQQFRPRGKRLLLLELKSKGVSDGDIATALTTPSEEGHFRSEIEDGKGESREGSDEGFDELGAALKVGEKYGRKYIQSPEREFRQKVGQHLAGKGFDWDTIETVLKRIRQN